MKNLFAIIMSLILCLSLLAGCGVENNESSDGESKSSNAAISQTESTEAESSEDISKEDTLNESSSEESLIEENSSEENSSEASSSEESSSDQVSGEEVSEESSVEETSEESSEPEQPIEIDPYDALLKSMEEAASKFAVAYFGYYGMVDDEDLLPFITTRTPQMCEDMPFLTSIPKERIVGEAWGEVFCIVPADKDYSVKVVYYQLSEEGDLLSQETIYESQSGEPIFLFSSVSWDSDMSVIITDDQGEIYNWRPVLNYKQSIDQIYDDNDNQIIYDFSAYNEYCAYNYLQNLNDEYWDYEYPTKDDLVNTAWGGEDYIFGELASQYKVRFYENTLDVSWTDIYGEDHEYLGATWELTQNGDFSVLAIDFGEFAGVLRYNLLIDKEYGELYTTVDVTNGKIEPGLEVLSRSLYEKTFNVPNPMDMVGSWERYLTEFEGYEEETAPGECTIVITGDSEDSLYISYSDRSSPQSDYANKALILEKGEIYMGCGNSEWYADVDYASEIYIEEITFCITLLENGDLMLQNFWYLDGAPTVSYEWFRRVD